jgi:hypothetical protein
VGWNSGMFNTVAGGDPRLDGCKFEILLGLSEGGLNGLGGLGCVDNPNLEQIKELLRVGSWDNVVAEEDADLVCTANGRIFHPVAGPMGLLTHCELRKSNSRRAEEAMEERERNLEKQADSQPNRASDAATNASPLKGGATSGSVARPYTRRWLFAHPGGYEASQLAPPQDATAADHEKALAGPHHFAIGTLRAVHCDNPALSLTVFSEGKEVRLRTNNYFEVQYSVLDLALKGDLNPCSDLEGRPAKVEYIESPITDAASWIVGIEIHK